MIILKIFLIVSAFTASVPGALLGFSLLVAACTFNNRMSGSNCLWQSSGAFVYSLSAKKIVEYCCQTSVTLSMSVTMFSSVSLTYQHNGNRWPIHRVGKVWKIVLLRFLAKVNVLEKKSIIKVVDHAKIYNFVTSTFNFTKKYMWKQKNELPRISVLWSVTVQFFLKDKCFGPKKLISRKLLDFFSKKNCIYLRH